MTHFLTKRWVIATYFAGLFAVLSALAYAGVVVKPNGHKLLGWLINYEAGIVRRGLLGEVLLLLQNATGLTAEILVWATQVGIYAIFLSATCLIAIRLADRLAFIFVLFSPAVFLYPVATWLAVGRKEILYFAVLALLCLALGRVRSTTLSLALVGLALLAMVPVVLAHEMTASYLPYLLLLGFISVRGLPGRLVLVGLALIPAGAALFVMLTPFNAEQVAALCQSFEGRLAKPDILAECPTGETAPAWLNKSTAEAMAFVAMLLPGALISIGPALMLTAVGFLPALPLIEDFDEEDRRWLGIGFAVAVVASLPLFFVAVDWGRFIHIHAVSMALILMTLAARMPAARFRAASALVFYPAGWMVAAYALAWNLGLLDLLVGGGIPHAYAQRFGLIP